MKKALDNILTLFIVGIVFLIIIPLNTVILDFMLIINISLSLVIFLTTMYIKEPLEFSAFPSILLITTLFRVALSVSSTRLILGNSGFAGNVIKTFGEFVIGGNAVVGFMIFLIIVIVQFIVITKGSERVAEVAARFTLDAMPGKQMAIDADLNAGLIDDETAKARRLKIQREADFYGSMDGATKFVKGDAIISIIIVFINSIGGIIIGMLQGGRTFAEVLSIYIIATVGDGLVSQIPALLISTATGMIVTRAASENNLSTDLNRQLFSYPLVLLIAGGVAIVMAAIPGFPVLALLAIGGALIGGSFYLKKQRKEPVEAPPFEELPVSEMDYYKKTENIYSLLNVEPIEVEVGYSLIPLVDESRGGSFINRVVMLRRNFAEELGVVIPSVTLQDHSDMDLNEYRIRLKGEVIASGSVLADRFLAMNPLDGAEEIPGIDTMEPAFGIPARWIHADQRELAQMNGYTVIDPLSVIMTHLSEVIKRHLHELIGRREVNQLLDNLKQTHKDLVEETVPAILSKADLQKILCNLLAEGISIRDLATIIETAAEYAPTMKDTDLLTEYVRQALKRTITRKYAANGHLKVITLHPDAENLIMAGVKKNGNSSYVSLDPDVMQKLIASHMQEEKKMRENVGEVIVLTSPVVRFYYHKLIEQFSPDSVVLSFSEIHADVNIQALGTIAV
ncbi:MAG TPA: flagellar biosynthesis protein FlhA [Clostridiales bacterium]|jgi:flagellar biosynthesis protein FlhA|nr:flagellar biosynthesis protein FlhA [Clostridiales bacterium]